MWRRGRRAGVEALSGSALWLGSRSQRCALPLAPPRRLHTHAPAFSVRSPPLPRKGCVHLIFRSAGDAAHRMDPAGRIVVARMRRYATAQGQRALGQQGAAEDEESELEEDEEEIEWDEDDDEGGEDYYLGGQAVLGTTEAKKETKSKKGQRKTTEREWLPLREYKKLLLERELDALHERMLAGHKIDPDHFSLLVHRRCLLVKAQDDGLLQYIWDLAKVGFKLGITSPAVLGSIMGRFAAHNKVELAKEAYSFILENNQNQETGKNVLIKQRDFEHLTRGIAQSGESGHALDLLAHLIKQDPEIYSFITNQKPIDPDTVRTVLEAVHQPQDTARAKDMMKHLEEKLAPAKVHADATAFNSLLAGYNALNNPEEALAIWSKMNNEAIKPDLWSYVEATESYVQLGDNDTALKMMDSITEILREQFKDNQSSSNESSEYNLSDEEDEELDNGRSTNDRRSTKPPKDPALNNWNAVLSHFVRRGHLTESFEIWRRMREDAQLQPNTKTALLLIRACVNNNHLERAHLVVGNMRKYHNLKVSADGWTEIVGGYGALGRIEAMWKNVQKMYKDGGVQPNDHTWDVVERTCRSHGVWDQYEAKVERMKKTIENDQARKQRAYEKKEKAYRPTKPASTPSSKKQVPSKSAKA